MKKKLLISTISILSIITQIGAKEIDKDKIRSMNKILQDPALTIKDVLDRGDIYFIRVEAKSQRGSRMFTAFVDKDNSRVYFGNGFDKDGSLITFPADPTIVKDGISFSYGDGKKEIYLVTDPECPYCAKFEREMDGKLGDYRVHVILYPLPFHKKAPAMAEWIMQGGDDIERHKRFRDIMLNSSKEYKSLIKDPKKPFVYTADIKKSIMKAKKAVVELSAKGTPMVFDTSFKQIPRSALLQKSTKDENATKSEDNSTK